MRENELERIILFRVLYRYYTIAIDEEQISRVSRQYVKWTAIGRIAPLHCQTRCIKPNSITAAAVLHCRRVTKQTNETRNKQSLLQNHVIVPHCTALYIFSLETTSGSARQTVTLLPTNNHPYSSSLEVKSRDE